MDDRQSCTIEIEGQETAGPETSYPGKNLIAQLMLLCKQRGITIWIECPLVELLSGNGRVVSAIVKRNGISVNVLAKNGVLLCAGGFAHNVLMRQVNAVDPIDNK